MVTMTLYQDSKRDTDVKNRLLDSMGEGKGGYVKQITSPGLMHETRCSGLVHWDDPEGCDGRKVGGELRMGNTCAPVADSCQCMAKPLQYCKVSSLQLK